MAGAATPQLAAAVSAAGGLGALGSAVLTADELREQAAAVRSATEAPFNLNFFCHAPTEPTAELAERARERVAPLYAERGLGEPPEPHDDDPTRFDGARLEAVLEIRPAVVSFQFGLPDEPAVAAIRDSGIRVIATATTVAEAERLEELGADAVIAQGAEAGGPSRQLPGRGRRRAGRDARPGPAGRRRGRGAGGGGRWDRRRSRARSGARAGRRRRPDRHRLPRLSRGRNPPGPSSGGARDAGGCDHDHPRLLRAAPRARFATA